MRKIDIKLYGGRGLFGGRETPLEAVIISCDKCDKCSFYKNNTCLKIRNLGKICKYGRRDTVQGYTSRAKKYYEFKRKYEQDECYSRLKRPNSTIGKIDNEFVINLPFIRYEDGEIKDPSLGDSLIYINEKEFNNTFIKELLDFKPHAMFGGIITDYQDKKVPNFLSDLKRNFKEIYENFIKEYPRYDTKVSYIGKKAYINTLNEDSVLIDCHNNEWIKEKEEIVCYKWRTWLPFNGSGTETRIKITEDMIYKITDNNQVNENTKFVN